MPLFKDITLGQYFPVDSAIHRLDPRSKLLSSLLLMGFLLVSNKITLILVCTLFVLVILKIAKLRLRVVLRNLRAFLWLFLLTFIVHLVYSYGRVLVSIPLIGLDITYTGLEKGFFYTSRIALLIIIAGVLTATTTPIELTDAIAKLAAPLRRLKIPVQEMAMMMAIALRFIPILLEEADRIKKAQLSRGAKFEGNIIQKIKSVIPLVLPLFVSAFKKADDLAVAMESRCYQTGRGRTSFRELKFRAGDYLSILISAALFLVVVVT